MKHIQFLVEISLFFTNFLDAGLLDEDLPTTEKPLHKNNRHDRLLVENQSIKTFHTPIRTPKTSDNYYNQKKSSQFNRNCHDWKTDPKGLKYHGNQKTAYTISKYQKYSDIETSCQPWNSNVPNRNNIKNFRPNHSFCRNPDNDKNGPWCYLRQYTTAWYYDHENGNYYSYRSGVHPFIGNIGYCKKLIPQCGEDVPEEDRDKLTKNQQKQQQQQISQPEQLPNPKGQCFKKPKTLKGAKAITMPYFTQTNNQKWCQNSCKKYKTEKNNYKYYALSNRSTCFCLLRYSNNPAIDCNRWCTDYQQTKFCGGSSVMNVFEI